MNTSPSFSPTALRPSNLSGAPTSSRFTARLTQGAHNRFRAGALALRLVPCLLVSVIYLAAFAQYSLDWHTIDGGGGTSTGGVYLIKGTIGQPDAGDMSGGNYALQGGFWGVIAAVRTLGAPLLSIFRTTTSRVSVTWPSPSTGWKLQQNTNSVSSSNWSNITVGIKDNGTAKTLILNPAAGNCFYRLHKL